MKVISCIKMFFLILASAGLSDPRERSQILFFTYCMCRKWASQYKGNTETKIKNSGNSGGMTVYMCMCEGKRERERLIPLVD